MNIVEREQLIELYENGPKRLEEILAKLPLESLEYKSGPDRWSVSEIVAHIVDADLLSYLRFGKAVSEPGETLSLYDPDKWIKKLTTKHMTLKEYFTVLKSFRAYLIILLNNIDESIWDNKVIHPQRGEISLVDILSIYAKHIDVHMVQINRTFEAWKRAKNGELVDPNVSLL